MINLDHNASTPLDPRVRDAMVAQLRADAGLANPSSLHRQGQRARAMLEAARARVAAAVGAERLGVTFTSGGTEADNLAVLGVCRALRAAGRPSGLLTSPLEHPAVAEAGAQLEREGHVVATLEVDAEGRIHREALGQALALHPEVGLVSLMWAQHELGNRYDIPGLVAAARAVAPSVLVHSDAVQAFGKLPIDFADADLDLLSISAHKIHGPRGVGALIHRPHLRIDPLWRGGHQERGRRGGTEAGLLIHGLAVAAELAASEWESRHRHVTELRARLLEGLDRIEGAHVHGDPDEHTGNTVNVGLAGCDGQLVLIALDLEGVGVATGSACTAGTLEPSPALLALGVPLNEARASIRISFSKDNGPDDVASLLRVLPEVMSRIRSADSTAKASG